MMRIVDQKNKISRKELQKMAGKMFDNLVKAVVDIKKEMMVVDGEMHADEERLLLEKGSKQINLWGINLHSEKNGKEFIEFDSVINLRPRQNNRTRGVDDPELREEIITIVNRMIEK